MKKITLLTLAFLLCFAMSALAKETYIEEKWKDFIETANPEYAAYHGEIDTTLVPLGDEYLQGFGEVKYSVTKDIEFSGYFYREMLKELEGWRDFLSSDLTVSLKDRVYNRNRLALALKGSFTVLKLQEVDGIWDNTMATRMFTGGLYSNFRVNDHFVLYNNLDVTYEKGLTGEKFVNGLEWGLSASSSLKVKLEYEYSHFHPGNRELLAAFKSQFQKQNTYLVELNKALYGSVLEGWEMTNTVESKVIPTVLLTGQFYFSTDESERISFNAEKSIKFITLKAGMTQYFQRGEDSVLRYNWGVAVKPLKGLELSGQFAGLSGHLLSVELNYTL